MNLKLSWITEAAFIILATLICFLFALTFESFEGAADNFVHYRISRNAFSHPELFLDHWGKPVFTLLTAPFALLGFKGMIFFNVLCGVLTCFYVYKIAKRLNLFAAPAAFFVCLAMPVYYLLMVSAMTEILFSLFLVLSIYLFLERKFLYSTIFLSFLFLVRNEGYIFYPVFGFLLLYKRHWKYLPILGTGFLIYSIVGYFYYDDFLWLINQNPYHDTSKLYGSGELFYFVSQYKYIFGPPVALLILIGLILSFIVFLQTLIRKKEIKEDFILIEVIWVIYFAAHSYAWWSGSAGSAGLNRVMGAVTPLAAITAVRAFELLEFKNIIPIKARFLFVLLSCAIIIWIPFRIIGLPKMYDEREKTIAVSVDWFKQSKYADKKIFCFEPMVYFLLDRSPYDREILEEGISDIEHPENSVKNGEIVFYDMHFGPNEGRIPLKRLLNNSHFKLINYFEPILPMKVLGGYEYGMFIFERVEKNNANNNELLSQLKKDKIKKTIYREIIPYSKGINGEEFTIVYERNVDEVKDLLSSHVLKTKVTYVSEENVENSEIYFIFSIEKDEEILIYGKQLLDMTNSGKEMEAILNVQINKKLTGNERLKIYFWNKKGNKGRIVNASYTLIEKSY